MGDSSMSSRPVSLNLVSSFENDFDLLGAGSKSVVLPEQLLKSSLLCPVLCPEWPPLKKCIYVNSVNRVWKNFVLIIFSKISASLTYLVLNCVR